MTSHPPEPPAHWPPPPQEERQAGRGQRPGPPEEWPAGRGQPPGPPEEWAAGRGQRPGAPEGWPARSRQRHPGDQPGNGHRAAANGAPSPPADYPPGTGYRQPPGHPSGAGSGPGGYPDYPDLPDYPQDTYSPRDGYFSGYPSMPDYPPTPDYPPAAGYQPSGYPPNGYPAGAYPANGYPSEAYAAAEEAPGGYPAGGSQVVELPAAGGGWALAAAPVTHEEYLHPGSVPPGHPGSVPPGAPGNAPGGAPGALRAPPAPAGPATPGAPPGLAPGLGRAAVPPDARWAMLGYLTVPFFGFLVPLAIYLTFLRRSRWLRAHAAQAVNVWLTVTLYELSAVIIGAMLVLDSPRVALTVVVPLVTALLLTALVFLVRAAAAAYRGQAYTFPRWLCTPLVR
jgi:uncharacterized Tic20 family protein